MFETAHNTETLGHCSRILDGLISRHEKPALNWLAARVPMTVVPDHLTLLGVFGALLASVSLAGSHYLPSLMWLALLGLFINWLGDSLDGSVARLRRIERPRYGFFVDHLSDAASQVLIVAGLGLSPYLRFDIVCVALVSYLLLSIYTLVKLHVSRTMRLTYFGVGPTEVRLLIGSGIVLAALVETPPLNTPIGAISLFDGAALLLAAFALASAVIMFARDAAQLAAIDPPRHGDPVEVRMAEIPGAPVSHIEIAALQKAEMRTPVP